MNNAKEENAAHTDADSTQPTDLADSEPQELPKHASRKDDAMDSEYADHLLSNKTQRRNVSKPMVLKVSATSPPESATNSFSSIHHHLSRLCLNPPKYIILSFNI